MTKTARGYALMFVLMVLSLLALSLGTLSWHLSANIAETRRVITTIRADSGCASALDLASRTIRGALATDPAVDPAELLDTLCTLGGCETINAQRVPQFLAPTGMSLETFAIALGAPRFPTNRLIPDGPFNGRVAVEQALVVTLRARDTSTGRVCEATDRFMVPSLPLLSFPIFGTAPVTRWAPPLSVRRENDGAPSRIHVNGNVTGTSLSTTDFVLPGPQFGSEPLPINLGTSTRGADRVLRPPVRAPTPSASQAALPTSLRWLVEPPTSSDSADLRRARLSVAADLVIIDGVWYNNINKSLPWPGVPIYSDHGGTGITHTAPASDIVDATASIGLGDLDYATGAFPALYSWYDRPDATSPIRNDQVTAGGGVLSYGPLAAVTSSTSCTVDADCEAALGTSGECIRPTSAAGTCARFEPGLWPAPAAPCSGGTDLRGVSECAVATRASALVDGARSGFRDGSLNISPININLRALQAALLSTTNDELGHALGVSALGPLRFNGVVYITSTFTGSSLPEQHSTSGGTGPAPLCFHTSNSTFEACPPSSASSSHAQRAQFTAPVGLCGAGTLASSFDAQPCSSASRPNAVRVYSGSRISAGAFPRGLTIATNLPLYVYGDLNRIQLSGSPPTAEPHTKVALVGDRVTFLSRTWRDKDHPWNVSGAGSPPATGVQVAEASLVTGVPLRTGNVHDVADVFRALQPFSNNHFVLRGHIALAFNSEYLDDTSTTNRVNGGLRWLPDYHLDNPGFQPPGLPRVALPPTGRWRQR